MSRKKNPEINAGSMADIAFLLLIFFLVTTTMDVDSGILRKIPKKNKTENEIVIKDRNILEVDINFKNEISVDGKSVQIKELKQLAIDFIDNAGGLDANNQPCNWCEGKKIKTLSVHPSKAFISLKADRNTEYTTYISTLDNLNAAYTFLRNKLSVKLYEKNYVSLLDEYKNSNYKDKSIEQKIKLIREKYPLLLSETELKN